jgi:tetratricopeptide (TPR) repeat protein
VQPPVSSLYICDPGLGGCVGSGPAIPGSVPGSDHRADWKATLRDVPSTRACYIESCSGTKAVRSPRREEHEDGGGRYCPVAGASCGAEIVPICRTGRPARHGASVKSVKRASGARAPRSGKLGVPADLGARIRKARTELRLSLAAVAGSDFSRAFLNQIELGKARPSTRTLQIIAERLHRPMEYFLQDPATSTTAIELSLAHAETRLRRGDAIRAERMLDELLAQPRLPADLRVRAQLSLGHAQLRLARPSDALKTLQAAYAATTGSSPAVMVEIQDRMGSAYYQLRQPSEAAHWHELARATYDQNRLNEPILKARVLGHRANLYYVVGAPEEAIAAYEAAIAAAGNLLDMQTLGGIYEGLALSLHDAGELGRALMYAQRSLRLFETLSDIRMTAQLRNNMAEILIEENRLEDAERLLTEGVLRLREFGDKELLPHLLAGLAEIALRHGDVAGATTRIQEALGVAAISDDPLARLSANRIAGRIYHASGDTKLARVYFDEAIKTAKAINSPMEIGRAFYDYARMLEAVGDPDAAACYRTAYEARHSAGSGGGRPPAS